MPNIICFTQDVQGEREWINSQFPGYVNLETESAGRWDINTSTGNFIREVAKNDVDRCDFDFIDSLDAKIVKTIYNNNLDLVIHDNIILKADELLVNSDIKFLNSDNNHIKNYMMFTFTRCGTVFTESILMKKYPRIRSDHYGPPDSDKVDVIKEVCLHNNVRICLNYRSSWWDWLTSQVIMLTNKSPLHYSDNINWNELKSTTINKEIIDYYEKILINTFTFWIQIRLVLPTHQFSLFRFEDILPLYQAETDHKQVPYDKNKLITNYSEAHRIFLEQYLPRWQSIEKKALRFLKQLNVTPTVDI